MGVALLKLPGDRLHLPSRRAPWGSLPGGQQGSAEMLTGPSEGDLDSSGADRQTSRRAGLRSLSTSAAVPGAAEAKKPRPPPHSVYGQETPFQPTSDHFTSPLMTLHWLPIPHQTKSTISAGVHHAPLKSSMGTGLAQGHMGKPQGPSG